MTDKLFYKSVADSEFEAEVKSCIKTDKGYQIILDRTLFYPEGGGQPADNGTIGNAEIYDVHDRNGEVVHYSDKPLEVGVKVKGFVDMDRRHRLMQQHSGEHIVSGLIHNKFGYDNIGFHMGSDCITIDFNGTLTEQDLNGIEKEANEIIYRDFEPHIFYPSRDELARLSYRSKKELEGDVRIVSFAQCDTCACCGLHVIRTGEIGIIKIIGFQKYKGGTRVSMLAGRQAYEDYARKDSAVHGISTLLSAKPYDIKTAVEKLMNERNEIKEKLVIAKRKIFEMKMASVKDNERCPIFFEDGLEPFELRLFADMLMEKFPSAAVFCGNDEEGYKYAIGSNKADIVSFIKEANNALNGKGGGKGNMVQGSFAAKADKIERYVWNGLK